MRQLFAGFICTVTIFVLLIQFLYENFLHVTGFLTGTLQTHARKYNLPIDHLSFEFNMLSLYRDQAEVAEAMTSLQFGEELELDKQVETPTDGVLVHGLFMDGFR